MSLIDIVIIGLLGTAVFAALRSMAKRGGTGCCQCSQYTKGKSSCHCAVNKEGRPGNE